MYLEIANKVTVFLTEDVLEEGDHLPGLEGPVYLLVHGVCGRRTEVGELCKVPNNCFIMRIYTYM